MTNEERMQNFMNMVAKYGKKDETLTDDYFEIIKDGDHKTDHLIITLECPKCGCRVEANSKSKKLKMDEEECRRTYSCECPCCGYTMYDIDRKSVRI